jgi:hypothetical protein
VENMTMTRLATLALLLLAARASAQGCPMGGGGCPSGGCPQGGGSSMSRGAITVAALPQFRIVWRDVERVTPAATTGAKAPAPREKPLLVYVHDGEDVDARYAVEELEALRDEGVVVAAQFFEAVRIDLEHARQDPALARLVKRAPCLVALRPGLEAGKTLAGAPSKGALFAALRATLRKDYENCPRKTLDEQREILAARAAIARERERAEELEGPERATLEGELEAREADLDAREKGLFTLKPRAS